MAEVHWIGEKLGEGAEVPFDEGLEIWVDMEAVWFPGGRKHEWCGSVVIVVPKVVNEFEASMVDVPSKLLLAHGVGLGDEREAFL